MLKMKIKSILILFLFYIFKLNTAIFNDDVIKPFIFEKYSWSTQNNENSLVLYGTAFSILSDNIVTINGIENICSFANASKIQGYDQIFCPPSATISIEDGTPFIVSVKSFGIGSNVRSWYFIKPISVTLQNLITIGGPVEFDGIFSTSNMSIGVQLSIGGTTCFIQRLNETKLAFISPYKSTPGLYEFVLDINGLQFKTNITYIASPTPIIFGVYYWSTLPNGQKVLSLPCKYFTEYANNIIALNYVDYNASAAVRVPGTDYFVITLLDDTPTKSLQPAELFIVVAKVAGQPSISYFFYLTRSISFTTTTSLQSIGGIATFEGSLGTSVTSPTTLLVGGEPCYIAQITSSNIKFHYPAKTDGIYTFVLTIGGFQYIQNVTYITSPKPTILNKYNWEYGNTLVLNGNWFSYFQTNIVFINNTSYSTPPAYPSFLANYDSIRFQPGFSFSVGDKFSIVVQVGDQSSKVSNFVFLQSISMTLQTLNTTGGIATFFGSYFVSDANYVTLTINGVLCDVISVTPVSLTFRYPPNVNGHYQFTINIGGFESLTVVEYVVPPLPTILNSYKWDTSLSNNITSKLIFTGTSFSYVNPNYLYINDANYTATLAVGSEIPGHDEITFENDTLSSLLLKEDQLFTVQVSTGGLFSNIVTFNFIKPISISKSDIYNIGGFDGGQYVTLEGVYGTFNKSIVTLYIGGIEYPIFSIEPTKIKFSYTLLPELGNNQLLLIIGGLKYETTINVLPVPKPILLNNYHWSYSSSLSPSSSPNDNMILILRGKSFNYNSINTININDIDYNSTTTAILNNGMDEITLNNSSSLSELEIGNSFTVFVNNGIEKSNSVTFIFIKLISISTKSLNDSGGEITFSGEYHVSDTILVSLLIDNTIVQVTNITTTTITFNYPPKPAGQYNLLINIGGFEYSTSIQYIITPTPSPNPTPTINTSSSSTPSSSTAGTQQTTGSPTPSSDDNVDTPSISSKLSISFILIIFLLSIIL